MIDVRRRMSSLQLFCPREYSETDIVGDFEIRFKYSENLLVFVAMNFNRNIRRTDPKISTIISEFEVHHIRTQI